MLCTPSGPEGLSPGSCGGRAGDHLAASLLETLRGDVEALATHGSHITRGGGALYDNSSAERAVQGNQRILT